MTWHLISRRSRWRGNLGTKVKKIVKNIWVSSDVMFKTCVHFGQVYLKHFLAIPTVLWSLYGHYKTID